MADLLNDPLDLASSPAVGNTTPDNTLIPTGAASLNGAGGNQEINLQESPEGAPINLQDQTGDVVDNPEVAKNRAKRWNFALGDHSPGEDNIASQLMFGQEAALRDNAVAMENIRQRDIRSGLVQSLIQAAGPNAAADKLDQIYSLTNDQLQQDPSTILEKLFGEKKVIEGTSRNDGDIVGKALAENNDAAHLIMDAGAKIIASKEIAQQALEKLEQEKNSMGWAPFLWDTAETMVPFKSWYTLSNVIKTGPKNSFLLGNNLGEQAQHYYSLPPAEAKVALTNAIEEIKGHNLLDAMNFAAFIAGFSSSDIVAGNLMSYADLSTAVPGVGVVSAGTYKAGARVVAGSTKNLAKAVGDIVKGAAKRSADPAVEAEAAGDIAKSATIRTFEQFTKDANNNGAVNSFNDLAGEMKSITNPGDITSGTGLAMSSENIQRLKDALAKNAKTLTDGMFSNTYAIDRLEAGSDALAAAVDHSYSVWEREHPHLVGGVLNVDLKPLDEATAGALYDYRLTRAIHDYNQDLINAQGLNTKYSQYILHKTNFEKALQDINEIVANLGGKAQTPETVAEGLKFKWGTFLKSITKDEETKALLADRIKRATASLKELKGNTAKERALFERMHSSEKTLSKTPPGIEIPKDVSVSKAPGNIDYLNVKLGKNPDYRLGGDVEAHPTVTAKLDKASKYFNPKNTAQSIKELTPANLEKIGTVPHVRPNTTHALIQIANPHKATLFDSELEARLWAEKLYNLPANGYRVGQKGTGWYIEVQKALDETAKSVNNALKIRTTGTSPRRVLEYLGWLRSPEYQLSDEMRRARLVATYGTSALRQATAEVAGNIAKIPSTFGIGRLLGRKGSRNDFLEFIEHQRVTKLPENDAPGYFSNNQLELERDWQNMHGRPPTFDESLAYWSYRQMHDAELGMLNLGWLRDKSRQGWEMFDFGKLNGKVADKPNYEGKFLRDFPKTREPAGFLVWDEKSENMQYIYTGGASETRRKALNTLQDLHEVENYKIVQLTHVRESNKLKEQLKAANASVPNGDIHYVLTKEVSTSPLSYLQVPGRPGGHHLYDATFYLRQPVLKTFGGVTTYYGDKNMAGFNTEAKALEFEKKFNTAREMLIKDIHSKIDSDVVDEYIRKNLPFSPNDFRRQFLEGGYDLHTKFHVTPRDTSVDSQVNLSQHYAPERFRRAEDSEFNLYRNAVNLRAGGERGDTLYTITDIGSKENPTFKFQEAGMINPLETLDRSMYATTRGRFLEDLKYKAVQEFAAKYGDLLEVNKTELMRNPARYLYEGKFKNIQGQDAALVMEARNMRRATLEFLNYKTQFQRDSDSLKTMIANKVDGWNKGKLPSISDDNWFFYDKPLIQRVRNAVFDLKMAWNPAQILLQAQGTAHIAGVLGPVAGIRAGGAAIITRMMRLYGDDPEMLSHVSKSLLKAAGFSEHEFKEAYQYYKASGFGNVGHEVADLNDFTRPNMINTLTNPVGEIYSTFMDTGRMFFRTGERFVRDAAWFGAYQEWRKANPAALFDETAAQKVLQRASLLNMDMSSASAASWQRGMLGVTSQFWGYQVRLFEQLTGNRLTTAEKLRVLATNSMIYGIPVSAGTLTIGWPFADTVKQEALKRGYDFDENPMTRVAMYGMLNEVARQFVAGGSTNINTRMGPGNLSFIKDFSEKGGIEFWGGVAGSTLANAFFSAEPLAYALASMFNGKDETYQLTWKDFDRILTNYSGYDAFTRAVVAMNTGNYFAKNGQLMDKMTTSEAWLRFIAGTEPERISDVRNINALNKTLREIQNHELPFVRENFRAMMQAYYNDDIDSARMYGIRMRAHIQAGGWTPADMSHLWRQTTDGYETLVERTTRKFGLSTPERLDYFYKSLKKRPE